jgi:hypothetical protein
MNNLQESFVIADKFVFVRCFELLGLLELITYIHKNNHAVNDLIFFMIYLYFH